MENFKELAKLYKWAAETEAADNKKLDTYNENENCMVRSVCKQ